MCEELKRKRHLLYQGMFSQQPASQHNQNITSVWHQFHHADSTITHYRISSAKVYVIMEDLGSSLRTLTRSRSSTNGQRTSLTNQQHAYDDDQNHCPVLVLDLCLYRVVKQLCDGRVLPFGVRQLIKDFAFVSLDNVTLREAVRLWCSNDRETALAQYGDINDWDVSHVTDMSFLFRDTTFNDRIDRWDVRHVTSMRGMFFNAKLFNQPLEGWEVSHVTTMESMFYGAVSFNQPLSMWDTRCVINMRCMFSRATLFNGTIATWSVSEVTNMSYLFYSASSFDQSISTWDVSRVTNMTGLFDAAESFNQPLAALGTFAMS